VEYMGIQNLCSERAIKSLDIRILIRFARLDIDDLYVIFMAPMDKVIRSHFGAVIHSNSSWLTVLGY
jgi:hypothetical protein